MIVRRLLAILRGRGHQDPARILSRIVIIDRPISFVGRADRDLEAMHAYARAAQSISRTPDAKVREEMKATAKAAAKSTADHAGRRRATSRCAPAKQNEERHHRRGRRDRAVPNLK